MAQWEHHVPAPLRPYVASCVGYEHRMSPAAIHRGVPSTALTLIVAFDEPLDCGWSLDGGASFPTLVAGLHTRPSIIRTHGHQHGIQLALTPLGCRALFGLPAAALAHEIMPGDEGARLPSSLRERMQDAGWAERFRLLDEHLLARLDPSRDMRPELRRAWGVVCAAHGGVRVEALADDVGFSRRRLSTTFRDEFGLTPSQASRVARYAYARELLRGGISLGDVAARAGYADQPHLTREWRVFTGTTPRASLEEFPIVQDPGTADAAGS